MPQLDKLAFINEKYPFCVGIAHALPVKVTSLYVRLLGIPIELVSMLYG